MHCQQINIQHIIVINKREENHLGESENNSYRES